MIKRQLILLLFFLLTGCGFKLRGMADMPSWLTHVTVIVQNAHRDLEPLLENQLKAYHITVLSKPTPSSYMLIIESDYSQQQITNVSASTTPRQYELLYTVRFSLLSPKGKVLIPLSSVSVIRPLTVNNDRILGSNAEEATLYSEMRKEAVMQIINKLSHR